MPGTQRVGAADLAGSRQTLLFQMIPWNLIPDPAWFTYAVRIFPSASSTLSPRATPEVVLAHQRCPEVSVYDYGDDYDRRFDKHPSSTDVSWGTPCGAETLRGAETDNCRRQGTMTALFRVPCQRPGQ